MYSPGPVPCYLHPWNPYSNYSRVGCILNLSVQPWSCTSICPVARDQPLGPGTWRKMSCSFSCFAFVFSGIKMPKKRDAKAEFCVQKGSATRWISAEAKRAQRPGKSRGRAKRGLKIRVSLYCRRQQLCERVLLVDVCFV